MDDTYVELSKITLIHKAGTLTPGPHLGPLVAQHISVLHMLHLIQSQPSFLSRIILHTGQCMASPPATMPWENRSRHKHRNDDKLMVLRIYLTIIHRRGGEKW